MKTLQAFHAILSEGRNSGGAVAEALERMTDESATHIEAELRIGIEAGEIRSDLERGLRRETKYMMPTIAWRTAPALSRLAPVSCAEMPRIVPMMAIASAAGSRLQADQAVVKSGWRLFDRLHERNGVLQQWP